MILLVREVDKYLVYHVEKYGHNVGRHYSNGTADFLLTEMATKQVEMDVHGTSKCSFHKY